MADIYVECLDLPVDAVGRCAVSREVSVCLALHRVEWRRTLASTSSGGVLCHFRAPDAESVRMALRPMRVTIASIWVDERA